MSTKQQRTAWNLTKMAQEYDPRRSHMQSVFYEIAKDSGLAMVDLSDFDLDGTYVFVPKDEWKEAYKLRKSREKIGMLDPEWPQVRLARKYRNDAMKHEF